MWDLKDYIDRKWMYEYSGALPAMLDDVDPGMVKLDFADYMRGARTQALEPTGGVSKDQPSGNRVDVL